MYRRYVRHVRWWNREREARWGKEGTIGSHRIVWISWPGQTAQTIDSSDFAFAKRGNDWFAALPAVSRFSSVCSSWATTLWARPRLRTSLQLSAAILLRENSRSPIRRHSQSSMWIRSRSNVHMRREIYDTKRAIAAVQQMSSEKRRLFELIGR